MTIVNSIVGYILSGILATLKFIWYIAAAAFGYVLFICFSLVIAFAAGYGIWNLLT